MVIRIDRLKGIWSQTRFSYLLNHDLVQNTLSLSGVQIAGYVVPFVTLPYLARVLGAGGWGLVAFVQSFGSFVTLFAEYGFAFSATREVARHRNHREKLTDILAGVLGAKGLIAVASLILAFSIRTWVPVFREHPVLLWTGMFWALSQAFSMSWFFQGLERLRLVAALEIIFKTLGTIATFVFVRRPDDTWLVLVTQGSGFLLSFVVGLALAYRDLPIRIPTHRSVWEALRMGWVMFLSRGSASLFAVGNAFILGFFVSPQLVGYYAGAEKISKAVLGLLGPVSTTLYPRLSHLVHRDRTRAARLARLGAVVLGLGGIALGALMWAFAPFIVRMILGSGFMPAVSVLRVLALLLPLWAFNTTLGMLWMVPLGLDRAFTAIILVAGILNVALASALASTFAELGMAWAVVSAEFFVFCSFSLVLYRLKLHPMSRPANPRTDMAQVDL